MTDIAAEQAMLAGTGAQTSSPGRALGAAREARGLTIAQVAETLRFAPRQIQALENDDYAALPGATVVRGMVRNYARVVGLDAEPLLAELRQRLAPASGPLSIGANIPFRPSNPRSTLFYVVLTSILALIGIAVALDSLFDTRAWLKGERSVAETPAAAESAPSPVAAAAPPIEPQSPAPTEAIPAATAEIVPDTRATAPGVRRLRFRFERDSWVEVRSPGGAALHIGLNPAGTERVIEGQPPFVIVVGAAAGVQLTYDDQPIDLARHTRIDVARLTLE